MPRPRCGWPRAGAEPSQPLGTSDDRRWPCPVPGRRRSPKGNALLVRAIVSTAVAVGALHPIAFGAGSNARSARPAVRRTASRRFDLDDDATPVRDRKTSVRVGTFYVRCETLEPASQIFESASQKSQSRSQKSEPGSQISEPTSQKSEPGSQKSQSMSQKSEPGQEES